MSVGVERTDVLVVGAGALGLASAWQLLRAGIRRVLVVDKEADVARHQTGRNSGVLHSGIYYEPGSLKAETCRRGRRAMEAFCEKEGVSLERCGKVVVATESAELPALQRIAENALGNGVHTESVGPERLKEIEPGARGIRALWVPDTGIVDFVGVCRALVQGIEQYGGALLRNAAVHFARSTRAGVLVETSAGPVEARVVVACAGLQADRVAELLGIAPVVRIVPFRGEYHLLGERARALVKNLIYPVPDQRFPFLGVHFTRRFDGTIDCGPNAVLALAREDYGNNDIDVRDLFDSLAYGGFQKLAREHWRYCLAEMHRSLSKRAFAAALQRLVPEVEEEDLRPGPSGIRAQAVTADGKLLSDFSIEERRHIICVLNAPSPAATASLEIGRIIAEKARRQLEA